jgi:hypothetical protein
MPKIQFTTNIPVELRLQSIEGELTPSQFGGNQIKFIAHEGPFWVSEAVGSILADQIRKKHIQPHVPVEVARREIAQSNGRKGIQWTIDPLGFVPGEQPDGTFAVEAARSQVSEVRSQNNGANGGKPPAPPVPASSRPQDDEHNHSAPVVGRAVPANGNGHSTGTNGAAAPAAERTKTKLEDALKTVVAACHAAREYAKQIGYEGMPPFTSEDIRTMANTLMIQNGNGGPR